MSEREKRERDRVGQREIVRMRYKNRGEVEGEIVRIRDIN